MVHRFIERLGARQRWVRQTPTRPRLFFDAGPQVIYAIGDIHGRYDLLARMEREIEDDAARFPGHKWIVLLGDYVDRGPASAQVLDHLLRPPPARFSRYCLAGNHEQLMLSYLAEPDPHNAWLGLGGHETLRSYGIEKILGRRSMLPVLASRIPAEHVRFLQTAPVLLSIPGYVFVHAGLRPGVPLSKQSDHDMLRIRPKDELLPPSTEFLTIHGHTPVAEVRAQSGRINIDTGAFATGILSCVRIQQNGRISRLAVR